MTTYRTEWECCDSAVETECWIPEQCPLCNPDPAAWVAAWATEWRWQVACLVWAEQCRFKQYEFGDTSVGDGFKALVIGTEAMFALATELQP